MPPRSPASATRSRRPRAPSAARHFAVIGAGIAGIACARTLVQAGHRVTVFEKSDRVGGRTATHDTPFGGFDAGAQYFTVRDDRFAQALATVPGVCRPWSATTVRVLDAAGRVAAASQPPSEAHWVACPGMDALVGAWAQPLQQAGCLLTGARVVCIEADPLRPRGWQVCTESDDGSQQVVAGFDAVLMAQPATPARALLVSSDLYTPLADALADVSIASCWTLMLAFPQAVRPGLTTLGPQWNAARSTHHRIAWLARESSKPQRSSVERWTVQASPAWSDEHLEDNATRVQDKLLKAFAEVTGIRATPSHAQVRRWRYAQTQQPLGRSHLWDADAQLGACGDWCLGHRLEDAFISGLELALAVA
ncbi:NAD(P)/FAD-dependent oxidoreductase [Acidovorax sp. SRB_24]|uniref:NAD(P)/FAD-dependent oxidoreductase n=1 Tax=Acidovorax sp. SRB_24 TaxID=1962700 RepID=UPI00145E07BF|nr:FAD-dependent oxidoreductase [Acidovorax sp. SRB_24]NMM76516.1 amine oxidase [Acidovorax sp. SRB_24]